MDKMKLVIFGDDWDVYQVAYRELIDNPRVTYIPTFRPRGLAGIVQRLQFNPRVNSMVGMPGKGLWNARYLRGIGAQRPCFLIMERWLRLESGIRLLPYLRRRYPQSPVVCFVQDLLETIEDQYTGRPVDVDYLKRYCHLVVSYDTADAQKYGLAYHPTVFSPVCLDREESAPRYDLYFLGRDKGRLQLLADISREALRRGLKCHFVMLSVPEGERITCEGITYRDTPMPYRDNLRLCAQSRCIVELLQSEASSPTFRTWESIALNRRLLTTHTAIRSSAIFDKRYISVFSSLTDLDWDFPAGDAPFGGNPNPYQERIRPESFIRYIEDKLNIQIDR